MCGRFLFTEEQLQDVREIIQEVQDKKDQNPELYEEIKFGEIYPTNRVPVIEDQGNGLVQKVTGWGFPKWDGKGVIINARAETATEKKMFRDSVLHRRCVIPTSGFFEWNRDKKKFLFRQQGQNILYLAGFYNGYGNEERFVILTTDANDSMKEIHHRMPVILQREETATWITNQDAALKIMERIPINVEKSAV